MPPRRPHSCGSPPRSVAGSSPSESRIATVDVLPDPINTSYTLADQNHRFAVVVALRWRAVRSGEPANAAASAWTHREGDSERVFTGSFGDLVTESDLVARVRVVKHRAALFSDETTVSTTYAAQLVEVLHSRGKEPATDGNIEIVRPGGTVLLDGHTVEVYEQDSHRLSWVMSTCCSSTRKGRRAIALRLAPRAHLKSTTISLIKCRGTMAL